MSNDKRKPDYQIFDNGAKVRDDIKSAVISITVDERLDQAAIATIELRDENAKCSTGDMFKIGSPLKVELGFVGATKVVFEGEVTGSKGAFPRRGPQTFTVIGMDKFHRLRRNRRAQVYLSMKDSEIVGQVASNAGLSGQAEATPVKLDHVFQVNQTDADFVLERAKLYGYEVYVDQAKLVFRKPKLDEGPVATLKWHETLKTFQPTISLATSQEVVISAWDMKEKKGIKKSSKKGDELSLMGSQKPGNEILAGKFGAPVFQRPFIPASGQAEVDAFAKGIFQERSQRFITGLGTGEGNPDIRRGKVVKIDAIGEMLSGNYYVHAVIHTLHPGSGFTSAFHVRKTALKQASAPPPPPKPAPAPKKEAPPPAPKQDVTFITSTDGPGGSVEGMPGILRSPDGKTKSVTLGKDGKVQEKDAPAGTYVLELESVSDPQISQEP